MELIFNRVSDAVHSFAAPDTVKRTSQVRQAADQVENRSSRPVRDEYIPEEKQDPTGRYWKGKDEEGQPGIYFDDPDRAAAPESERVGKNPAAGGSKKAASGGREDKVTGSTDKVDREIEKLKKRRKELKQQLNTETDEDRIENLKNELEQVERELRQKDNDTYRRQHMEVTYS